MSPFSSRTDWSPVPNALSLMLERHRASGRTILDLTASNPTACGIEYPGAAILAALARPAALRYEPHPRGDATAREAVARIYRDAGVPMSADQIVLTASTSEAYSHLFRLLAEPGEAVLAPVPSYPLFEMLARINDLELRPYRLSAGSGFCIELEELEQAAEMPGVRAILLVNPGNPTGTFVSVAEREALLAIASRHGLALICDEVFSDYAWAPQAAPRADRPATLAGESAALVFVLNGLSKMAGLPQLKLGWIAASGPPDTLTEALRRLELIADIYLSVGSPVQQALPELLGMKAGIQRRILERVRSNRTWLESACAPPHPCHCLPAEGGWCSIIQVPRTRTDEQWCLELLERDGVLVHPGYFFDFPADGYLVVGLLAPEADFRSGAQLLLDRIRRDA